MEMARYEREATKGRDHGKEIAMRSIMKDQNQSRRRQLSGRSYKNNKTVLSRSSVSQRSRLARLKMASVTTRTKRLDLEIMGLQKNDTGDDDTIDDTQSKSILSQSELWDLLQRIHQQNKSLSRKNNYGDDDVDIIALKDDFLFSQHSNENVSENKGEHELSGVTELTLKNWKDVNVIALRSIALMLGPSITSLDISECMNLNDYFFQVICARLFSIKYLVLSNTHITDLTCRNIAYFCRHTLLRLNLSHCSLITNESCGWLAGCIGNFTTQSTRGKKDNGSYSQLKSLDLSHCSKISDRGLSFLGKGCPLLKFLNLSFCDHITNKGIMVLSKGCRRLQILNLRQCPKISDQGVKALAQHCRELVSLNLSYCCDITDKSVIALARKCVNLQSLSLEAMKQISASGLCELSRHCPNLSTLNITGCDFVTRDDLLAFIRGIGFVQEATSFFGFVPLDNANSMKFDFQESSLRAQSAKVIQKHMCQARDRGISRNQPKILVRRERAAKILQRSFRQLKEWKDHLRIEEEHKKNEASKIIQIFLKQKTRKLYLERKKKQNRELISKSLASKVIQAMYRGYYIRARDTVVRQAIHAYRKYRFEKLRNDSATLIQSTTRRWKAILLLEFLRERFTVMTVNANRIQRFFCLVLYLKRKERETLARNEIYRKAANRIQYMIRYYFAKKRGRVTLSAMKKQKQKQIDSATYILHFMKRYMERKVASQMLEELRRERNAAIAIQKYYRGYMVLHWKYLSINETAGHVFSQHDKEVELSRENALSRVFRKQNASDDSTDDDDDEDFDNNDKEYEEYNESDDCDNSDHSVSRLPDIKLLMVGKNCKVFWPKYNQYFDGIIKKKHPRKEKVSIEYENGYQEWIDLRKKRDQFLIYDNSAWKTLDIFMPEEVREHKKHHIDQQKKKLRQQQLQLQQEESLLEESETSDEKLYKEELLVELRHKSFVCCGLLEEYYADKENNTRRKNKNIWIEEQAKFSNASKSFAFSLVKARKVLDFGEEGNCLNDEEGKELEYYIELNSQMMKVLDAISENH